MVNYYGERVGKIRDVLLKMSVGETIKMQKQEADKLIGQFCVMRNKGVFDSSYRFRTRYIDGLTHITCISKPVL